MTQEITARLAGKIVRLNMEVGMKVEEDDVPAVIEES
ncbi:biotin/lipoyl-binding protein [Desulfococcus sp.]